MIAPLANRTPILTFLISSGYTFLIPQSTHAQAVPNVHYQWRANFSEKKDGGGVTVYTFQNGTVLSLEVEAPTQRVSTSSLPGGSMISPKLWQDPSSWDNPLVLANVAGDVVTYVDGVRKDVSTVITNPPDAGKILKNSGPTNANYGIEVSEVKRDEASLFKLSVDIPVIWDVTISGGTVISMTQSPIVLQTLNVNGHLFGNRDALTIHEEFSNTGSIENFGGTFIGNFSNSGNLTVAGHLVAQRQFTNSGTITVLRNASLSHDGPTTSHGPIRLADGDLDFPDGLTDNGGISGYGQLKIDIRESIGITADQDDRLLKIGGNNVSPTIDNGAAIRAINGGHLEISSATVNGGGDHRGRG